VTDYFGEARSILECGASTRTWFELRKFMDDWPPLDQGEMERIVHYVVDRTKRWPAEVCHLHLIDIESAREALSSRWFPAVRSLTLEGRLHRPGKRILYPAALRSMPTLFMHIEHLAIHEGHTALNETTLGVLATEAYCGRLESLDLSNNGLTDHELMAWLDSQQTSHLRHLALDENELTGRCVRPLLRSGLLEQLRTFSIANNKLSVLGLETLEGQLERLGLEEYDLDGNEPEQHDEEIEWRGWEDATDLEEWEKWSEWSRED